MRVSRPRMCTWRRLTPQTKATPREPGASLGTCLESLCSPAPSTATSSQPPQHLTYQELNSLSGVSLDVTLPGDSLSFKLCSAAQSCRTLCDPMHYWGPPGSSVRGISQAKILEWVATSFSRGSFRPRDQTSSPALAGGFCNTWTREVQGWLTIGISALFPSPCFGSLTSNCVPIML